MVQCRIAPVAIQKFYDLSGNVVANGKLHTYLSETTTNAATYTDATGATENANPILLDAHGEAPEIWLDPKITYTFVLDNSSGTTIWTVNQITTGAADSSPSVTEYGADPTATSDSTTAFNEAINAAILSPTGTGEIIVPTGEYILGTVASPGSHGLLWKGGSFLASGAQRPSLPGVQETSLSNTKIFLQTITTPTDDSLVSIFVPLHIREGPQGL